MASCARVEKKKDRPRKRLGLPETAGIYPLGTYIQADGTTGWQVVQYSTCPTFLLYSTGR